MPSIFYGNVRSKMIYMGDLFRTTGATSHYIENFSSISRIPHNIELTVLWRLYDDKLYADFGLR